MFFISTFSHIDKLKITTLIESVACFADSHQFCAMERLYGPEVDTDLSALYGNTAGIKCPQSLVSELANVLTAFDTTHHQLKITGILPNTISAEVTADAVLAHHWHDAHWQVYGRFIFHVLYDQDRWVITKQHFLLSDVAGTHGLLDEVTACTAQTRTPYLQRKCNEQLVVNFLDAVDSRDLTALIELWDEQGIEDVAMTNGVQPLRLVGKQAILDGFRLCRPLDIHQSRSHQRFYPMQDPQLVFVEYTLTKIQDTKVSTVTLASLFHIDDGLILFHRQFFNINS